MHQKLINCKLLKSSLKNLVISVSTFWKFLFNCFVCFQSNNYKKTLYLHDVSKNHTYLFMFKYLYGSTADGWSSSVAEYTFCTKYTFCKINLKHKYFVPLIIQGHQEILLNCRHLWEPLKPFLRAWSPLFSTVHFQQFDS